MYSLIEWDESLDLTEFYETAKIKGFENNSSQKALVDCFKSERDFKVWILYYQNKAAGSVACHSLDVLPNAYRICARTCVFTDLLPYKQLRSLGYTIKRHQNITAQFYIPKCIEYAGKDKNLYITSHPSDVGTQRAVHNVYCPALVETGALTKECELLYRGSVQTFWKLNTETFLEQLSREVRW